MEEAIDIGMKFYHEYDFGTSTKLILRVISVKWLQKSKSEPIRLLARNEAPLINCNTCGNIATRTGSRGWFCDKCAGNFTKEESFLPVVNSPRVGICGYTGK